MSTLLPGNSQAKFFASLSYRIGIPKRAVNSRSWESVTRARASFSVDRVFDPDSVISTLNNSVLVDFLIHILKLLFFLWSPFCFILFNYEPFSALVQSASALQCVWRNYVRQFLILGALSAISHPKRVPGWVNTGVESTMEGNPWWSTSSKSRSRTDVFVLQKCKWENMSASWNIASSNAWFFISLPGITNPFWIWTKW